MSWSGPTSLSAAVYLVLVLGAVFQRVGETTFDTKFDLTADPGGFLARSLRLWNPMASFGDLQNQAYGYLFPQGSFFVAADLAGLPDWWAQRIWTALLLVTAYEGMRRLVRAFLPHAGGYLAVVGGLAFAVSPRLLGLAGVLSAEVLPTAVLPWVLLPLVLGLRHRISPRRAGLLSGAAVLLMGGVNAVENLAALPVAFYLVVSGLRTAAGRRLAAWWVPATTLACLWWFLPLLVLGRYSPPFLNYIETSGATTRPLGWSNALRGADHWLAFIFVGGRPWWPGAHELATMPVLVVATAAVAALGYFGLFARGFAMRGPMLWSLATGLVCLTVAHSGVAASPLDAWVRSLLDGSLAPLRNVHKVDPLVRVPLALGLVHACTVLGALAGRYVPRYVRRVPEGGAPRPLPVVAMVVLVGLVLTSAAPLMAGTMRKSGWQEVPDAWLQASRFLEDEAAGMSLVLPGAGFGQQWWGWTIDEPIQGVAHTPWTTRSQIPLVPGPTIRFLDSIESRIQDGGGSISLGDVLARAGITHVVVRRDLDLFAADVPAPDRVDRALLGSAGLQRVASFGRSGFGDRSMIDVLEVEGDVRRVELVAAADVQHLVGGTEDLLTALEAGLIRRDTPVLVGPGRGAPQIVGDGYRRQERQFGRLHDSLSQVMTEREPYRVQRAEHDYRGVTGGVRSAAAYRGVESVTASSSVGYVDTLGPVRPELGPAAAVDGQPDTFWRSAPYEDPVGQWLQLDFGEPRPLRTLELQIGVDGVSATPVERVRVDAGDQSRAYSVDQKTGLVNVVLDGSPVEDVRITVLDVAGDDRQAVVAVREVSIPGTPITRRLEVPAAGATDDTSFVFRADPPRRPCVLGVLGPRCALDEARPSSEQGRMARSFELDTVGSWVVQGAVVARASREAADLLLPLERKAVTRASSVLGNDPAVSGVYAFDGDPLRPWLAGADTTEATLTMSWRRPRTVTQLRVTSSSTPATRPARAVVTAGGETRTVELGADHFGYFEPLTARKIRIRFVAERSTLDPSGKPLPLGIGELDLRGADSTKYAPSPNAETGALCGLGPEVVVDGEVRRTEVLGHVDDVVNGTTLSWRVCDGPVRLFPGRHEVRVDATVQFAPTRLDLVTPVAATLRVQQPDRRDVEVRSWQATSRVLDVGPGPRAYLRVAENVNGGWSAQIDGTPLAPAVLDGWQQAFKIPAGEGGRVVLTFDPDASYRAALAAGLVSALLLVCAVAFDLLRPAHVPPEPAPRRTGSGPRRVVRFGLLTALGAASWLLAGPVVAVTVLAIGAVGPPRTPAAGVGAFLVLASGIVAATSDALPAGAPLTSSDLVASVAVGVLLATTLGIRRGRTHHAAKEPGDV